MNKLSRNILKIIFISLILIVSVGSIYASEDIVSDLDFESDDLDSDIDEDLDDEFEEDEFEEDEFDDDSDDEFEEDLDDDWDEEDYNETIISDFDFLKYKLTFYLNNYGNTSLNWTLSQNFTDEYQIFLKNPSNYTLNESLEGYEIYLKIFDSVNSTFKDYNLTENETQYLQFMVIYYLNHFGNLSANYTWNETDEFSKYIPSIWFLATSYSGGASYCEPEYNLNPIAVVGDILMRHESNYGNLTSDDNETSFIEMDFELNGFVVILLVIILLFAILI